VEYELLGWPGDGVKLALDYRTFSYAGKFVMSNTGKAVAVDPAAESRTEGDLPAAEREDVRDPDGTVVGAVAFNADRTDADTAWLRYVTVREDRRGEGVGPRLCAFTTARLHQRGYDRVRIAVNNPFAYHALHKAGFGDTGETTGIAERVLAHPAPDEVDYGAGLAWYRERDLTEKERAFVESRRRSGPPSVLQTRGDH